MVLLKTSLAGACLLVAGILLITVFGQYVTVEVEQIQNRGVEPHAEFLVGDLVDRTYNLPGGVSTSGSIGVTQAPTNASGDIRFIVLDDAHYQKWNSGSPTESSFSAERQGQFNFSFTTANGGVYHFVFDNRASLFKKYVVLSVSYSEVMVSHVPDQRIPYVGWSFLVGGAIVLAYGLLRKPPIPWA